MPETSTLSEIYKELLSQKNIYCSPDNIDQEIEDRKKNSKLTKFLKVSEQFHESLFTDIPLFISGEIDSSKKNYLYSYFNEPNEELLKQKFDKLLTEEDGDMNVLIGKQIEANKNKNSEIKQALVQDDPKNKIQRFDNTYSKEFIKFITLKESELLHPSSFRKFINGHFTKLSFNDWVEIIESFEDQLQNSLADENDKFGARNYFINYFCLVDHYRFFELNLSPTRKKFLNFLTNIENKVEKEILNSLYLEIEEQLQNTFYSLKDIHTTKDFKQLDENNMLLFDSYLSSLTPDEIFFFDEKFFSPEELTKCTYEKEYWEKLSKYVDKKLKETTQLIDELS